MNNPTVISLGGSIVVPPSGIDIDFLRSFRNLIFSEISKGRKFVIVVGGGATARNYIDAAGRVDVGVPDADKDWIGIHATRLNAHLLRTIFRSVSHPRVNDNPHHYEEFLHCAEPVIVASGWRPGFSTDFDAVVLGNNLGAKQIINLSNIDYVYDKDPRENPDARKITAMTWQEYRKLIGGGWSPGLHAPFDPIASQFAAEHRMSVLIMAGKNLENLRNYFEGKTWQGTEIAD